MDVTESNFPDSGHRALAHSFRSSSTSGRSGAGRAVSSVRRSSAGRRRARGKGRAGQGRRRRKPSAWRATYRIQSIPAVKAFRDGKVAAEFVGAQPPQAVEQLPRLAAPLGGGRAGRTRATRRRCARRSSSSRRARTPRFRSRGCLHARGEARRGAGAPLAGARQLRRRRPGGADRARARRRRGRAAGSTDLGDAFAALDAGDHERALDLLLEALPSADGARDDIRRVMSASSTSSASIIRSLASRAAGSPQRSTDPQPVTARASAGPRPRQPSGSRPATRTPSRRTGRRAANRRSSSQRHRSDPVGVLTGSASVRARVCVEKSSSRILMPIVRPQRRCLTSAAHSSLDEPSEDLLEAPRVGDVAVERRLARLGDHLALLRDRCLVLEARPSLQLGGEPQPEALRELLRWRCGELGERVDPERTQPLGGLRADPGHQPAWRSAEALAGLLAREDHEPARLLRVRGDLRDELVRPDTDRAPEPGRAVRSPGRPAASTRAERRAR